jgi:hypothetical protein
MKTLVFDTSSLISLATNNLLWIGEPLQKKFGGQFLLPPSVREEIIDDPLQSKRFKFEAMQLLAEIDKNVFTLYSNSPLDEEVKNLLNIANRIFIARGKYIKVLHHGEVGALLVAEKLGSDALVIDERSTRLLVESPRALAKIFRNRMNTSVKIDGKNLKKFQERFGHLNILRSVELSVIAFELGLLNKYLVPDSVSKADLLDAVLWGLKLRGCSVSEFEIQTIIENELS